MYNYNNFPKDQKAVALGYDKKKDIAPKVIAIGKSLIAEEIIKIAKEHNIPIYENSALVQILSVLEINQHIPPEVYGTVAEILSYIYQKEESLATEKKKEGG